MRISIAAIVIILCTGFVLPASAHSVYHRVENKGISVRVFYAEDDPIGFSEYEIFGPGDATPHQSGKTDRNGILSFLPDRSGTWDIKVLGDSEHGIHGTSIKVDVDEAFDMVAFTKPLVGKYVRLFVGLSVLLALFGIWALLAARRKKSPSKAGS